MRHPVSGGDEPLSGALPAWELAAMEAVGTIIEFWGFKRNHGRLWAFLYLRARPMPAVELVRELGLSKGAVSMITRELEQWGVLRRVRGPGAADRAGSRATWQFVAEQDLMGMMRSVLERREISLFGRVEAELEQAERLAAATPEAAPGELERLARLRRLATLVCASMELFMASAHMDMRVALHTLDAEPDERPNQGRS